jgi:hypothetical protein
LIEDEHFFLNYLQQHNQQLMILQLKILQRALRSLDGLWVPALACFKMKEFILA